MKIGLHVAPHPDKDLAKEGMIYVQVWLRNEGEEDWTLFAQQIMEKTLLTKRFPDGISSLAGKHATIELQQDGDK